MLGQHQGWPSLPRPPTTKYQVEEIPMPLSMYQASVPVFVQVLTALSKVLDKAEAHAAAKKIDPAVLLGCRLAPDMFPLVRQVQTTCDMAKGAAARLGGA